MLVLFILDFCFALFVGGVGFWLGGEVCGSSVAKRYIDECTEQTHELIKTKKQLSEAISLLEECTISDPQHPFTAVIAGERGDRIKEFIERCEE